MSIYIHTYERFATPCFGGMSGKQLATEWLGVSPLFSHIHILMGIYIRIYICVYRRFATPCFGGMSGKRFAIEWLGKSPFKVLLSNLYILMNTYQLIYIYIYMNASPLLVSAACRASSLLRNGWVSYI